MSGHKRPLNRSITVGCVAFIAVLCVLLSIANSNFYRQFVYDDYRAYIANILDLTAAHIDGDDLEACIDSQEESEAYQEALGFMDGLMDSFGDIHYLYAVRPLSTEDTGNMMSVLSAERYYDRNVDTEGNLFLGWVSGDEYDAETAARFFDIMEGDGVVFFEESTEWGRDFTGAMPIKNSAGEGVAVLAADIDVSFIDGMVRRFALVNVGTAVAVGAVFIVLALFWSRRNITGPIRKLERSAVGFADRSHGQRDVEALSFEAPRIEADNEIRALSDAVVKMTEDIREYVSEIATVETRAANMQELATRDALTGIRNKTAYDNEVRRVEAGIAEGDKKVGLAIVDLNFLKQVNDDYGHDKGDEAIKELCHLVCVVFAHSPVFRIGGDEFVVVLRGGDYEHCDELVGRFEAELAARAGDDGLEPWKRISAAVGVAFFDEDLDEGVDDLFRRADRVMYARKEQMHALR